MKQPGRNMELNVMTANTNNDQAKEAELIQTYIAQGSGWHCHCPAEPGCFRCEPERGC